MRDWFTSLPGGHELAVGFAAALLVSALLFAISLRWQRIPGALTSSERHRARASRLSRWLPALAIPVLGVVLVLALSWALFPPRRPVTLILVSRAHSSSDSRPEFCKRTDAASDERFDDQSRWNTVDIGPVVDAVLERYVGSPESWDLNVPENRQLLRQRVREAYANVTPQVIAGAAEASEPLDVGVARFQNLDRRLIESAELSVLELVAGSFNTREIRVRAGQSLDSRMTWHVSQDVMNARGANMLLCAVVDPRPTSALKIVQLAEAHLTADGALSFWAIVQGDFPAGAKSAQFRLDVVSAEPGSAAVLVEVSVSRDDLNGRIVICPGQRCTRALPAHDIDALQSVHRDLANGHVTAARLVARRTEDAPDVSTPIVTITSNRMSPLIATNQDKLLQAVFEATKSEAMMRPFRDELGSRDLELPEIVGASRAKNYALVTERGVVIAKNEASARRHADRWLGKPTDGDWRGNQIDLGRADTFSWRALPVIPTLLWSAKDGAGIQILATARLTNGTIWDLKKPAEERPFVIAIRGSDPAVVIGIDAPAQLIDATQARRDPFVTLALMDSIAFAVRFLDGRVDDQISTAQSKLDNRGYAQLAEPLVDDGDVERAYAASVKARDALVATLVAAYLIALMLVRRRPS